MKQPMPVTVCAWFGARNAVSAPVPSKETVRLMIERLQATCDCLNLQPVEDVLCETWQRPEGYAPNGHNDFLARITLTCDTGQLTRSLASWYQWQHPRWHWSDRPFPIAKTIEGGS